MKFSHTILTVFILFLFPLPMTQAKESIFDSKKEQYFLTESEKLLAAGKEVLDEGRLLQARQIFRKIITDYADSPETNEAKEKWGETIWKMIRSNIPSFETLNYEIVMNDTIGKIAKANGTTIELIKIRNNLVDNTIKPGQKLSLWIAPLTIDVHKSTNTLHVRLNGEIIKTYIVSTGKSDTTTPIGEFVIQERIPNPTWFHKGVIVPPNSPENWLGTRWLGFNIPKYGIHGTIYPELIGQSVSGGCVRMKNEDVEELYDIITPGTKVKIVE